MLDGVRGMAVLMVMVFHFFRRNAFTDFPAGRFLNSISYIGQTGVDLFFVLSGFLITGILLHSKDLPNYFKNFYARRALRILPLFYLALAFFFFALPVITDTGIAPARDQLWVWFNGVNIPIAFSSRNFQIPLHFWSLAVEEHFYFVWPAVVLLCTRRGLYVACVGCMVLSLVVRLIMMKLGLNFFFFTPCRLDSLAVGAMLAIFVRGKTGLAALDRLRPRIWLAGLFILMVPIWLFATGTFLTATVKYPMTALLYAAVLASALNPVRPMIGKVFSHRLPMVLGKYSYGLYVWDGMIHACEGRWTSREFVGRLTHFPMLTLITCVLLQFMVTFAVAALSWHLFEVHFLKLKRFFAYGSSTVPELIAAKK